MDGPLDGGKLSIKWSEDGVWMTGPTTIVFKGTLSAEFLKAVQWQHQSSWLKVATEAMKELINDSGLEIIVVVLWGSRLVQLLLKHHSVRFLGFLSKN